MATIEIIYMTNDSGDIWAVEVAHGGEANGDVDLITGVCGPLEQREITQANLDAVNFDFDTDPEQIEWAEDNLTRRVLAPFHGDR